MEPEPENNPAMSANNPNNSLPPEQDATLQKRRQIQEVMRDRTLSERDRRMRIQSLMDGSNPNTILNQLQQEHNQEIQQAVVDGLISSNNAQAVHAAVATGTAMPCVHYNRKCNIIAPCCGEVFGCRVCCVVCHGCSSRVGWGFLWH